MTSGANIDFNRLRFVSERADDSEAFFAVTIPEKPGAFRSLYETDVLSYCVLRLQW